jgi:3-methyladenine DNA glycosylase/8-oxoguanine DNA glycosylase
VRTNDDPLPPDRETTILLPLIGPFEVQPAMALLAATAIPGAETADPKSSAYTRFIPLPDSTPTEVTVRLHRDHVALTHAGLSGHDLDHLTTVVRSWLDLDADPDEIERALGADPVIGALVVTRPGLRVISYPAGFEAAVMTILGQHVSVAAARTFGARTVATFGGPPGENPGLRPFPTPAALAHATPAEIQSAVGVTHARARSIHALAIACAEGLVIEAQADGPELRRALLALPGIGPWTLELLAVRALGDRDGYPAGDLVLQRALRVRSAAAAKAAAVAWSPFRAYALFHLWSSALGI